eukprot:m.99470 g.99470  ORF g.99470 m.99470 type:complete len:801 (-) comp27164_c0_seq2:266-2668(-)
MEYHGVAVLTSILVFTDHVTLGHCTALVKARHTEEEASWHLNFGLMLIVGAVSLVLLLMACAKKGQKETAEEIPPTYGDPAMISNASYGASGNEESIGTYASVDPEPFPDSDPHTNPTSSAMYTEDPEYAQAPVPVSYQTRASLSQSRGSSVSRDVYGNSDTIFQNVIIRKEEVVLEEVLDSGQFGEVVCGIWNKNDGTQRQIAAKTIKGNISESGRSLFIQEMTTMAQLVHPNVLGVLAVTLEPLMLIMERVSEKSVKSYIEQQGYSHESPIPFPTLLEFVLQTATGMEYLAEHGIVHRDIAARNMLLHVESRTKFTCKVADFGLSKVTFSESFTSKNTDSKVPIPTRWTAMEALFKGRWSSSSDVWSWGVMAWELTTHGQFPYSLVWEDKPTVDLISKGMRLHQAELIPDDLYVILMKCWNVDVTMRPTFGKIVTLLKQLSQKLGEAQPDVRRFDVINRKDIEAILANNSVKTPASMYFYLPTYPRFVAAPPSTPENEIFLKIMPPEDEDPVFCPKLSPYANDLKNAGESFSEHIREKKSGKGELLLIGKDDLLPPGVFFVRQRDKEASRPLYALPDSKRRQSTLERKQNPGSFRSPFRSDTDAVAVEHRPTYDMKGSKPMLRLDNNNDIDIDDSSSDYTTQQTVWDELDKQRYANVPDQQKYGNMGNNRTMAHAFTLEDREVVMEWFRLGKVIRQDAEAALKGAGEGAFVVRKKSSAAKDFVITMYLGPNEDLCKHYRLVAEGPEPDFPVSMIDTVNGNMNFPNLWDLLAYYRSHVPGKKRALPIRLGDAVPVPDWI